MKQRRKKGLKSKFKYIGFFSHLNHWSKIIMTFFLMIIIFMAIKALEEAEGALVLQNRGIKKENETSLISVTYIKISLHLVFLIFMLPAGFNKFLSVLISV